MFESPVFCSTLRQAEHAAAEVALNELSKRGPSSTLAAKVLVSFVDTSGSMLLVWRISFWTFYLETLVDYQDSVLTLDNSVILL